MRDIEEIIPHSEWVEVGSSGGCTSSSSRNNKKKKGGGDADGKVLPSVPYRVKQWYEETHRKLPWRKVNPDPYEIWVSEIMSQQTQIATVIPYWQRWMVSFPSLGALADASEETVREHWTGLGYYRRATNLHKGAIYVVKELERKTLPTSLEGLLKVPGIGRYTASAIMSICHAASVAVVDGNVLRVVARLRGELDINVKEPAVVKSTWESANWLLKCGCGLLGNNAAESRATAGKRRSGKEEEDPNSTGSETSGSPPLAPPGIWNQAVMELGATLCKASTAPQCDSCPFATVCRSKQLLDSKKISAIEKVIPLVRPKTAQRIEHVVSCYITAGATQTTDDAKKKALLVRRPAEGLLASLFEFPSQVIGSSAQSQPKMLSMAKTIVASLKSKGYCHEPPQPNKSQKANKDNPMKNKKVKDDDKASSIVTTNSEFRYCGTAKHLFSHIDMTIHVFAVELLPSSSSSTSSVLPNCGGTGGDCRWVPTQEVHKQLGIAGTVRKVLTAVSVKKEERGPVGRKRIRITDGDEYR